MSLKALSFSSADIKIFIPFRRGTRSQYISKIRDQSLGARRGEARRSLDSLGMGELLGKKVSLHWKKGLEPNSRQLTGIEACRKLTKRQRETSRC